MLIITWAYGGETSCFYIGFSKNDCEVGNDLDDVKDELFGGKALFLVKLTIEVSKNSNANRGFTRHYNGS